MKSCAPVKQAHTNDTPGDLAAVVRLLVLDRCPGGTPQACIRGLNVRNTAQGDRADWKRTSLSTAAMLTLSPSQEITYVRSRHDPLMITAVEEDIDDEIRPCVAFRPSKLEILSLEGRYHALFWRPLLTSPYSGSDSRIDGLQIRSQLQFRVLSQLRV